MAVTIMMIVAFMRVVGIVMMFMIVMVVIMRMTVPCAVGVNMLMRGV
jgi:hypothetical protein